MAPLAKAGTAALTGLLLVLLGGCTAEAHPPGGVRADSAAPPLAASAGVTGMAALPQPPLPKPAVTASFTGLASWYGERFHGRLTASGERYDMAGLTAAHPSLPFGSRVRVTNLANGRSVVVVINDRGPYAKGRLVDLSHAAAKQLGIVEDGVAQVRLDVLSDAAG